MRENELVENTKFTSRFQFWEWNGIIRMKCVKPANYFGLHEQIEELRWELFFESVNLQFTWIWKVFSTNLHLLLFNSSQVFQRANKVCSLSNVVQRRQAWIYYATITIQHQIFHRLANPSIYVGLLSLLSNKYFLYFFIWKFLPSFHFHVLMFWNETTLDRKGNFIWTTESYSQV